MQTSVLQTDVLRVCRHQIKRRRHFCFDLLFLGKTLTKPQDFREKRIKKCSATFRSCFYVLLVCQKWEVSTKDGRNRLALSKLRSENSWQRLNKTGKTVKSIIKVPIGRISHKNSNHVKVAAAAGIMTLNQVTNKCPLPILKIYLLDTYLIWTVFKELTFKCLQEQNASDAIFLVDWYRFTVSGFWLKCGWSFQFNMCFKWCPKCGQPMLQWRPGIWLGTCLLWERYSRN